MREKLNNLIRNYLEIRRIIEEILFRGNRKELEAGKLLVNEILYNTQDNTNKLL